ncbi:YpmS family protein [Metabacillus litoralis]|uniref:YpmS family protein n=1 Tax=Metabacillus litoralis TaxID=152268 RepID=UPI001B9DBC57|nr:YpmS family protein [Metabacillus litoralis]UHA58222.1 YpmS family protein [Metabacillus litoralis]
MRRWKISFFVLAGINVLFLLFVTVSSLIPTEKPSAQNTKVSKEGTVPFLIKTQKSDLTHLVNHYLKQETDQQNLQYRVEFEDKVNVYGVVKAFNKDIDMKLILEPKVKSDGNVQLLVNELSIGQLKLPVSYVLKYMNTYYDLPKYVVIDSSKKMIDIYLDQLTLKSGLSARAESFNLEKDDITFTLYVPLP